MKPGYYRAAALLSTVWAVLLYLTGSFAAANWAISSWASGGRFVVGLLWLIGTLALFIAAFECSTTGRQDRS